MKVIRRSFIHYDTHKMTKGQEIAFFKDCKPGDLHATDIARPEILSNDESTLIHSIGLHLSGYGWDMKTTQPLMDHFILTPVLGETPYTNFPGTLCLLRTDHPGYSFPQPIEVGPNKPFHLKISVSKDLPVEIEAKRRGRGYRSARDPHLTARAFLFGFKQRTHGYPLDRYKCPR